MQLSGSAIPQERVLLAAMYRLPKIKHRHQEGPKPTPQDKLLSGSVFFSTLDLVSRYWQVPLDHDAHENSAFVTLGRTSTPTTFEQLMERVLKELQWQTLLLYLNDVIAFLKDFKSG